MNSFAILAQKRAQIKGRWQHQGTAEVDGGHKGRIAIILTVLTDHDVFGMEITMSLYQVCRTAGDILLRRNDRFGNLFQTTWVDLISRKALLVLWVACALQGSSGQGCLGYLPRSSLRTSG